MLQQLVYCKNATGEYILCRHGFPYSAFSEYSCLAFSTPCNFAPLFPFPAVSTRAFWCRCFISRCFMSLTFSVPSYISSIWGEVPTEAINIKNCVVGDLVDVITCAKFQNEIFRGYNFIGGWIFIFLFIFEWALQQCSATALPVIASAIQPITGSAVLRA